MNGFGALWRLKTHRSIRTMRSVPTATGSGREVWRRVQETVDVMAEGERRKVRRAQHERRRAAEIRPRGGRQ